MKLPLVYILILNWNGKEDTIECLSSLKKIDYPNYKIIIIDNGSTDNSIGIFKEKYPNIRILKNKKNLGYAEGNNVGIRYALKNKADYVLILNNDVVVDKKFLTELVKVAESDKNIGIVGGKIYFYGSRKVWFNGGVISYNKGPFINIRKNGKKIEEVDFINGCCALINSEVFNKIGFIDIDYFLYVEDIDFNIRLRKEGYLAYYTPKSIIYHKVSASSKKFTKEYYKSRNFIHFVKKNEAIKNRWRIYLLYLKNTLIEIILDMMKANFSKIYYKIYGIWDGIKNINGEKQL